MFFPTNFDPTRLPRILITTVILIIPSISLKAKDWKRHEIFTGAHVNSATAADYDGDGTQEIIFSAGHQILMYVGPEYKEQNILAESDSKQKPQCIHCALHDAVSYTHLTLPTKRIV